MAHIAQSEVVPANCLGELHDSAPDSDDALRLRERLLDDGYLFFRGLLPDDDVRAAREAVFGALAEVGEIAGPVGDGIFTGSSERVQRESDLGRFWRRVSEQWALRRVTHGREMQTVLSRLFGAPALAQDFIFLRPVNPGKFTHLHCDAPFFTRHTQAVLTAWIALTDVPAALGPLFVVEGSHRDAENVARYTDFDIVRDAPRKAALDQTPFAYACEKQTRLLTRDFTAGDVVVFGMHTLHGTFDNAATDNRCRLSCDVRFQPESAPRDPRYFGSQPGGTTGAGYGELVGAKPLDTPWHVR